MKFILKASACALALAAFAPATASAQAFFSDFEGTPTPATGTGFIQVASAHGWTAGTGPTNNTGLIEIQYGSVAGAPAAVVGGRAFVELDSTANSSMYRTITTAGTYTLSFLYSPRPNVGTGTNGIEALLNGVVLAPPGTLTGGTFTTTQWNSFSTNAFAVNVGDVLSFRAVGTSDSFGGYVDNISFAAVPEPASWAMMIGGFGLIGGAMRRRKTATLATA